MRAAPVRRSVRTLRVVVLGSAMSGVFAAGCTALEPAAVGRSPLPLPAVVEAALTPPSPGWGLELALLDEAETHERFGFSFRSFDELEGDFRVVRGELYRARSGGPTPLIVLSPILAGPVDDYRASRYFARAASARGVSAFFVHQETVILAPERDAWALEHRLRGNVRDNRRALALLAALPGVDPARLGSLGISLGAIKNVLLVASEPRLRANVLCLAGADVAGILLESREGLVLDYLAARESREGLGPASVAQEFADDLRSSAELAAAAIAPRRVLLVLARFDDKVPFARGLELRRLLGDPATHVLPLGHYTSLLLAPWVAGVALDWMVERWSAPGEVRPLFEERGGPAGAVRAGGQNSAGATVGCSRRDGYTPRLESVRRRARSSRRADPPAVPPAVASVARVSHVRRTPARASVPIREDAD